MEHELLQCMVDQLPHWRLLAVRSDCKHLGGMPEWLKGAGCKPVGSPTLVQIQLPPLYNSLSCLLRKGRSL